MGTDKPKCDKRTSQKSSRKKSITRVDKNAIQGKDKNPYSSINYNTLSRDEWHWLD